MALRAIEDHRPRSILDFGAGKGNVTRALREKFPRKEVIGYDPAFTGSELPESVDMVFSKDVLEHVEPDLLDSTLENLWNVSEMVSYHLIACHLAIHELADGRNAHLIVETPDWWQRKLRSAGFKILNENVIGEIKHPANHPPLATVKYECVLIKTDA